MKNYFRELILTQSSPALQYAEHLFSFAIHPNTAVVEARSHLPTLCVMPVPQSLALASSDRYYRAVVQEGRCWRYPFQLCYRELLEILPELEHLEWAIGPNGVPEQLGLIDAVLEVLLGGAE